MIAWLLPWTQKLIVVVWFRLILTSETCSVRRIVDNGPQLARIGNREPASDTVKDF